MVPVVGLAITIGWSASGCRNDHAAAQSSGLYDTTRILQHLSNECVGTPDCQTMGPQQAKVAAGKTASIVMQCPSDRPFITGWDTEQHEHLTASVVPRANSDGKQLTLLVANNADEPGDINVFLGCAAQAPKTTAVRQQRGAVPSNHGARR